MNATFPARTRIRSFAVVFLNVSWSFVKRKIHFFSFFLLCGPPESFMLVRWNLTFWALELGKLSGIERDQTAE